MKHIIRCPHCGWKTKEHYYVTDCTKEKQHAHEAKYGNGYSAYDAAFSSECPMCGNMGTKEEVVK